MTFLQRTSTWLFLVVILLCRIIIGLDFAPAGVNDHPADTSFHVDNAIAHLRQIARTPHSLGTSANDSVRSYIVSTCRSLGLDVDQRPFLVTDRWDGGAIIARGINVAATLHGSSSTASTATSAPVSKKILVMGHFDSEPNALGAGDDGMACISMLETARALRAGSPLPCDILFLFTNGEEEGLLGAQAFSRDSTQLRDVGLVLNFDGRGDAGKCLMFRTSPNNRWIIDEFANAPIHHNAGSLYSELFNLLPNNTDFSALKGTNIPGMDFAFAEGFVHYHNLTDNIDNIDRNTLQEEGDNMLGSIRHFSRLDLANARQRIFEAPNATFFNPLGSLFIHYPPSTNFFLLILANVAVLFALISGLYRRQIRPGHAALGLLLFLVALTVCYFVCSWTLDAIRTLWPLYLDYYPNSYNAYYFYLALAAETLTVFTLLYRWPVRKWSPSSLFIAIIVFLTILADLLYRFIPSGIYFLYFPLIGAALAFPAGFSPVPDSLKSSFIRLLGALLPIIFLAPLVYSLSEAFDIQAEAAFVAPVTGILLGLLLPIMSGSLRESRWFIPSTALIVLVIAAALGVIHGSYSPRQPLKTDIRYFVRADDRQAWWVSHSTKPDRWNKNFFANSSLHSNAYQYTHPSPGVRPELYSQAPYLDLPAPTLNITKDTTIDGRRLLSLRCQPAKGTTTIHMNFGHDHPADNIAMTTDGIVGFSDNIPGPFDRFDYIAPPDEGFDLTISTKPGQSFTIDLTSRTMGLPAAAGFPGYPPDVIPTAASWANTTMVQRSYTFQ